MLFEKAYTETTTDDPHSINQAPSVDGPSQTSTYVMHGPTAQRKVTTYHLILSPTHACNLRCEHCYLPDHATNALPKEVALRLVHEWNDIAAEETPGRRGIFHVKGGEPLVYKPILAMLRAMRTLPHLHFMMTTNGTLFRRPHWQALSELNDASTGAVTVVVSLDGASAATHELLRGQGSFEPTMRSLRGLRARGIRTYINCVIHADNIHELDAAVDFALGLGVAQLNFLPFVPKGFGQDMRNRQLPHAIVYEQLRDCYLRLPESDRQLLAGSLPDIVAREKNGILTAAHECVAAYRGLLYIKPDGHAYTCPNLEAREYSVGWVHTKPLRTILDGLPELFRLLHIDGTSDRYICMGERLLYERGKTMGGQKALSDLQADLDANVEHSIEFRRGRSVSFCVSRNW